MSEAISNTSPLLYLYRIGRIEWLPDLFAAVLVPRAVIIELERGRDRGYDVPAVSGYRWARHTEPQVTPSEWLALDLGPGELATMSLGLEHPDCIILLDDALARRLARAAGLNVWGTLRIVVEAKRQGLIGTVEPVVSELAGSGMWISNEVRERVLTLAGEV